MLNRSLLIATLFFVAPGAAFYLRGKYFDDLATAVSAGFLSLAAVFGTMTLTSRVLNIPFNELTVGLVYLGALLLLWAIGRCFGRETTRKQQITSVASIGPAIGVQALIWCRGTGDRRVIPNHDALFHSGFIGNITRNHSLDPKWIYATQGNPAEGGGLYPFSVHAMTSAIQQIARGIPSQSLYAVTFVVVVVIWPMSIYALASRLTIAQRLPVLPMCASLATAPIFNFPYGNLGWGGVPMVCGVVVLVIGTALVGESLDFSVKGFLCVSTVVLIALVTVHTSEVFLLPAFVLLLFASGVKSARFPSWLRRTIYLSPILALLYPRLEQLAGLSLFSPMANINPNEAGAIYQAAGQIVMLSPGINAHSLWIPLMVFGGILGISYIGAQRGLVALYVFLGSLTVLASWADHAGYRTFSIAVAPWYRQYQRLAYFLAVPVALLGGIAFAALGYVAIKEVTRTRLKRAKRTISAGLAIVCAIVVAVLSISRTSSVQKILFDNYSAQGASSQVAPKQSVFEKVRTPILASFDSGIGYWSVDFGLKTLAAPWLPAEDVALRELLLPGVSALPANPEISLAFRKSGIRYVATNIRSLAGAPLPSPVDMRNSRNFVEVWSDGSISLWRSRIVQTALVGETTGWDELESDSRRWLLNNSANLVIENFGKTERDVTLAFNLYQNACGSLRSYSVGDLIGVPITNAPFIPLAIPVTIGPEMRIELPIKVDADGCLDVPSSQNFFAGIGTVRVASP